MTPDEYEQAQERLAEIENEADGLYFELDMLQEEREQLENKIINYEDLQRALDE